MTLAKKLVVALGILVAAFSILAAMVISERSRYIYPNADTRSSFINSYRPEKVVDQFRSRDWSFAIGEPGGSSAGKRFASHYRIWQSDVLLNPGDDFKMMAALRNDILISLNQNGAQVADLYGSRTTNSGFEFRYTVGNTNGRVTADLTKPVGTENAASLPIRAGENFIGLKVEVNERWFRTRQSADSNTWAHSE